MTSSIFTHRSVYSVLLVVTLWVPNAWGGGQPEIRALLAAKRHTVLASRLAGPIERMTVNDGDRFDKGKELVLMNCAVQQAELEKAVAEQEAARHTLETRQRLQKLSSGSELETRMALADVARTGAEVKRAQAIVGMCSLTAPFSGRVVARQAQPFQSVTPGQPMLEILDDSDLSVQLIVPSRWLRWLEIATPLTLTLDETGETYAARVTMIGARIDPASQSVAVTADIQGTHANLLAGMSGTAIFSPPNGP
ncbi:MAG: efflux RND transporter periplasmic adaptor subunit [Magnetococcales bacterium]|nr:efflux RND transporter periplasmic adaptor subunit [Magnetococcales bacterium]